MAQGPLDVIVEETTEMTVMTDEETESEATPLGDPTDEATAPVRETEQDMDTFGICTKREEATHHITYF